MNIYYFCNQKTILVNITLKDSERERVQECLSHHMGFGFKILEVSLLYSRHGLVVVQVLPHLHVLRVAHIEGVCCGYSFLQLVYLRMEHSVSVSHPKLEGCVHTCGPR